MDNNNPPYQPQPMPSQPMGQPMSGQPYATPPYQPQYQGQPYVQPIMRPPKQPMDPAKKKRIILIVSICSGIAILGIAAAIIVPIFLRVDYSSTYQTAKELKPKIYDIYRSYDCDYIVDYVDSSYTSAKNYSEYVEGCKEAYSNGASELVVKLGNTDGIKRNDDLKLQYEKFSNEFSALTSGNAEDLTKKLALWQAHHSFVAAKSNLSYSSSSDAEFTTAANYLINSGNDTLKTYGEGWLEKSLAVSAAYRAYRAAGSNWSAAYNEYNNKLKEKDDWVAANKPDIATIAPLNFDDSYKMYSEFTTLYNLITDIYEKNYNSGSGDCTEFLGEVYCE